MKIDFREKNSGIMKALSPYTDLFQLEMLRLTTGDYLLNDQLLIERKRLPDFIASIKTGRLFRQANRMVQSKYHPLIILEGNKSEVNQSKMRREAVQEW